MSYSCLINIPFHIFFFISKFNDSYSVNFLLSQGYLLSQLHIIYTVYNWPIYSYLYIHSKMQLLNKKLNLIIHSAKKKIQVALFVIQRCFCTDSRLLPPPSTCTFIYKSSKHLWMPKLWQHEAQRKTENSERIEILSLQLSIAPFSLTEFHQKHDYNFLQLSLSWGPNDKPQK